ncbi:hypothetical protein BJ085DRAFT_41124 [Dimargaris cristalligena]|uniref:NADPH-dependent diflavin oxidoreductase 1 n=1 Tax=Dimargaris cristalligena TaxID=215637 RepID=A0A4P9ZS16_9FUNG|nr:hypothetical protein BJ085DRAFT_41124 [Dimargaris cristalligena]|eukprot:RKP36253.1 hypothetical protein BJ085DRAFT_41124 [Dimargaris cristalligena]
MHESILILYGSQTGCAEDVALRIGREARRRHFRPEIMALDSLERTRLPHIRLAIFVCSTTGQGEEPDNMKSFWKFLLRKSHSSSALQNLQFTIFGLGDSSYSKFNFPGRKLYRRLLQLGANCIYPRGEGDDQHYLGLDGTLDPWLGGLWETMLTLYSLSPDQEIIPDTARPESTYTVEPKPTSSTPPSAVTPPLSVVEPPGTVRMRLVRNERISTPDHFQDIRHVEFSRDPTDARPLSFSPGSVASLLPQNLPDEVSDFLDHMQWGDQADTPLVIRPREHWVHLPHVLRGTVTLRSLFETHFDIYSVPRRSFFEMLSYFTSDEMETEKLREFCSAEGQDDLYAYSHRVRRTIVEVLKDFRSYAIPLDYIFDIFPDIRARSYSISSCLMQYPDQVHLTVAIVNYRTRMSTPRHGVCSKWLVTLSPEDDMVLPVTIKPGTMNMPSDPTTPLIMIGPGTGVAPMRSFIQARIAQGAADNILIFGCRHAQKDFIYGDEWTTMVNKGQLKLFTAFSRDQDRKIYVQHLIRDAAKTLWPLLNDRKAVVLVSGNANRMPEDVKAAFVELVEQIGGYSKEGALNYIRLMEKTHRYQEECWY